MERLDNTESRYGLVAVAMHWVLAVLLAGLAAVGLYMTSLPDTAFDTRKVWLTIYHKEFGILALVLAMLRLAWNAGGVQPGLVGDDPEWQQVAARFVHLCFYGLMFALPITGWLMSSAAAIPVSFFGLFYLPDMIPPDEATFRLLIGVHHWLAYTLLLLLAVHAGAALRHHFVSGDETLARMLPGARPRQVTPTPR